MTKKEKHEKRMARFAARKVKVIPKNDIFAVWQNRNDAKRTVRRGGVYAKNA